MFERKPMEQIVNDMIRWARGTTSKLTDFRVGSKTRTLFETVALQIEELYDKMHRSVRKLIEENIYSVIGFDKIPATYASGIVRFSRTEASMEMAYPIPAGTTVMSNPTDFKAPINYQTTIDAVLDIGQTYIDVPVVSLEPGSRGNAGAGEIVSFVDQPSGIEAVTNPSAFVNGKDEETKEEQKNRFNSFVKANARGVLQSVEYGAKLAKLTNPTDGTTIEEVRQSIAMEDLPARKGEVDLYIWNGYGASSESLKAVVHQLMRGFYDENGNAVYGFKPAGIFVNILDASAKNLNLQLYLEAEEWSSVSELKPLAEAEIDYYFGNLQLGETFIQSALQARIKAVEGVKDCKLYASTDGTTFTMDNVSVNPWEINVAVKPIMYV